MTVASLLVLLFYPNTCISSAAANGGGEGRFHTFHPLLLLLPGVLCATRQRTRTQASQEIAGFFVRMLCLSRGGSSPLPSSSLPTGPALLLACDVHTASCPPISFQLCHSHSAPSFLPPLHSILRPAGSLSLSLSLALSPPSLSLPHAISLAPPWISPVSPRPLHPLISPPPSRMSGSFHLLSLTGTQPPLNPFSHHVWP